MMRSAARSGQRPAPPARVRREDTQGRSPLLQYDTYSDACAHFEDLLDAAGSGRVVTVRTDPGGVAVVDVRRLRRFLASRIPSRAHVRSEAGGWSVSLPALPVSTDGTPFDGAVDEMIDALREYADDWQDRLLYAPNHSGNWGVVHLIALSSDEQLRDWIVTARPRLRDAY